MLKLIVLIVVGKGMFYGQGGYKTVKDTPCARPKHLDKICRVPCTCHKEVGS